MPTQLVAEGSINKRYQKALKLEPDYILVLLESGQMNAVATFRVRRRVFDRYHTTGKVYGALKSLMENQFGIPPERFKGVARSGGELELRSKS